jgi:formylmethanofuran dehydrogenase subunit D
LVGEGELRLGTYRDIWADLVSDESPALRFLAPEQTLELNPLDAERLGVQHGQRVQVRASGEASLIATVGLRERMLEGTAFLIEGTAAEGANRLAGAGAISIGPAPADEPAPDPPAADRAGDDEEVPATPALIVTKREPAAWR